MPPCRLPPRSLVSPPPRPSCNVKNGLGDPTPTDIGVGFRWCSTQPTGYLASPLPRFCDSDKKGLLNHRNRDNL